MTPMRICFVCHEYPPGRYGGIGTFTRILGRSLVAAGHEVRVIGAYLPDHPGKSYEEDEGVRVWRFQASPGRLRWMANRIQVYRRIAEWSRRDEIDLVEVPDWQGWAAGWPRLPVPVAVRLHGSAWDPLESTCRHASLSIL